MTGFILRACITALGLWLATRLVSGIRIDDPWTLVFAGVLLGVVNAIVRPIAIILTLPLTILCLGLFLLVINTAMVALVAWHAPGVPHTRGILVGVRDRVCGLGDRMAGVIPDRAPGEDRRVCQAVLRWIQRGDWGLDRFSKGGAGAMP